MRKTLLLMLLLVSLSLAETPFEATTGAAELEIVRNWQLLAIGAIIVSLVLVAIAYSIGIGLEMPEMQAWARSELMQIFANAIIIISLVAIIAFLDGIVVAIVLGSGLNIPECSTPGESCLKGVSTAYLADYVDAAKSGALSTLKNNMQAASWANRRVGIYCTPAILPIPCLQAGFSTTFVGHFVLDQDMYAIVFEYYTNLLASLEAQKFFVEQISFNMGPVLLAIGVVARSFFFTRRLGGLLIAIAIGIMFFFPGMYVFDWFTLDMALAGDKAVGGEEGECPAECGNLPPLAFIEETGEPLTSVRDVYGSFATDEADKAQGILNGSINSAIGSNGTAEDKTVRSCYYGSDADCPVICRELPYPHTIAECVNKTAEIQQKCAAIPEECKVKRLVDTTSPFFNLAEYQQCPESCKIVPPLKSDCRTEKGDCLESRFDCRVYKRIGDELEWWPKPVKAEGTKYKECEYAQDCPVNLTAEESCSYVIPETGLCKDLCPECPPECRIEGADLSKLPESCFESEIELLPQCINCAEGCKVRKDDIDELDMPPGTCSGCPAEMRLVHPDLPGNYTSGGCSLDNCPIDYRLPVPRTACEMCLYSEEAYLYDPPIQTQCNDLCSPGDNLPVKEPGEYTKIGADGLVGRTEIKNVSKLLLPAYILPLFNIVATLVFIAGLSRMLGGDVEIPGISKVF